MRYFVMVILALGFLSSCQKSSFSEDSLLMWVEEYAKSHEATKSVEYQKGLFSKIDHAFCSSKEWGKTREFCMKMCNIREMTPVLVKMDKDSFSSYVNNCALFKALDSDALCYSAIMSCKLITGYVSSVINK